MVCLILIEIALVIKTLATEPQILQMSGIIILADFQDAQGVVRIGMHVVIARCRKLGISEALVEGEYALIGQGIFTGNLTSIRSGVDIAL